MTTVYPQQQQQHKQQCTLWLVLFALLSQVVTVTVAMRCDRTPDGVTAMRTAANGRFAIEVSGNPETYVPGEQYTIFLRSTTDYQVQHKFKDFLLLVEHEVSEKSLNVENQSPAVGNLQLYGDMLTKFSEKCRNAVIQTNSLPKSEVQVLWLAPPSGSGCVSISATVVETRDDWYSGDGPLSKILCEELQESEDVQPNVLRHCCACDEAKYEVTFEGLWSRNTHPKDFPSNSWLTRFSDIIGASHTVDYTFWNYGDVASEGLRQLAENGNTRMLESELKAKSEHIRTIIKARGISYPNITGRTFAVFRVDNRHHLMSLVSMLDPSPDWVVGVSSLELCLRNCSWVESRVLNLYPWDAGTDDGPTYISPNQPSTPRHPIRRIKSNSPNDPRSPFYDPAGGDMKPLARLYLTRQRLYEKNCDHVTQQQNSEYSNGDGEEGGYGGGGGQHGGEDSRCEVDEWSDWSPCSATCGKGVKYKQRGYKNEDSKYQCRMVLTKRAPCYAHIRYCRNQPHVQEDDPRCSLTDWGEWSGCSVSCGQGWKTRSRRYKNRSAAKRCAAANENAPLMEQNLECFGGRQCRQEEQQESDPSCEDRTWSTWSPCSATCGKGIKVRRKVSLDNSGFGFGASSTSSAQQTPRFSFSTFRRGRNFMDLAEEDDDENDDDNEEEEESDDPCMGLVERVECVSDEQPVCGEDQSGDTVLSCTLPKDIGLCRSNVDRWYFDFIRGACDIFSYSGCQGNSNNFKTLEQCQNVCDEYKITDNYINGIKPGSQMKEYYPNVDGSVIERPIGDVIDCQMSPWSVWTPCNTTCGRGFKTKHRIIKVHPMNGGKRCPEKILKKRKCKIPCPGDVDLGYSNTERRDTLPTWGPTGSINDIKMDCQMSRWSAWSPCSRSCGPHAVQQRTRSITVPSSGRGLHCGHRTEERPCALLSCPE